MAKGLNDCNFIGRLGQDPELKYLQDGTQVANFQIAVTETWKDRDGNKKEDTQWVRVQAWRGLAEVVGKYVHKGDQVFVKGKWKTRQWEDRDGNKRYATEITARDVIFLGSPSGAGRNAAQHEDMQPGPDDGVQQGCQDDPSSSGYPDEDNYPF